jgi:hypothetical protein
VHPILPTLRDLECARKGDAECLAARRQPTEVEIPERRDAVPDADGLEEGGH